MDDYARIDWRQLQDLTRDIFIGLGMSAGDAAIEAEVLVWANLRGVDSHGVQRVEEYAERIDKGGMDPRAQVEIVKETPAIVLVDAHRAMGPVVTTMAMEKVIDKARTVGVGWGLIRNNTHQGAMGYYAEMAARAGLAGMAVVCSPPNMAPPGARAAGTHNSPIAMAVPGRHKGPISLDMATSVAAGGKLQVAIDKGVPLGDDWALDKDGKPTTDPQAAAFLRPIAGYKGYGLALMFECFASLMAGNPLILPALRDEPDARSGGQNSFLAAIDIATFTDLDQFKEHVDELIEAMNNLPTVAGAPPVQVPGQPDAQVLAERTRDGIPLPPGTVAKLQRAATRLGLDLPAALA
ncbi:MAG: Ldh family oxidoreductase [Candidatus Latescibacteria bacterium]|nr:Ldh family oxidoreductase [Candidatus Latescibacterota bacterium]